MSALADLNNTINSGQAITSNDVEQSVADKLIDLLMYKRTPVFLTGAAGVGKSYTIRQIQSKIANSVILASTGVASLIIGGATMHSFFKLGICSTLTELKLFDQKNIKEFAERTNKSQAEAYRIYFYKLDEALNNVKLIIVDEISMLTSHHLEMIRYRYEQFGVENMPTMLVGDLLQLPPVKSDKLIIDSPYFKEFHTEYLTEVKRTSDKNFIEVQHKLREGICDKQVTDFIKSCDKDITDEERAEYVNLFSLKASAEKYNNKVLKSIEGKLYRITTKIVWQDEKVTAREATNFINDLLVGAEINLKIGCRIMFVKNNPGAGYMNGELGKLIDVDKETKELIVEKDDGVTVRVGKEIFEKNQIEGKRGNITMKTTIQASNYPCILGAGVSIHKSQGLSISKLYIDLKNVFENAQLYVAISRATSPDNLIIKNFRPDYVKVSKQVLEFYRELELNQCKG